MKNNKKTMPRQKTKADLHKKTERRSDKSLSRLMGLKDLYGAECAAYSAVVAKAIELAKLYSFVEIKTPILENPDLYKKSTRKGDEKEIYSVEGDRGEKQVLRPELTQGILRSFLENNLGENGTPARFFSVGSVFRHEKLSNGHYREFTQADFEIIGDKKPLMEAILISAANSFFGDLGIKVQVQINSLGDNSCRKEYSGKLAAFFKERGKKTKLCNACKANLLKNCLSLLDCREEECAKLREEAPQIADCLSAESREHFTKTLEFLDELGISYNFNPHLVRGLSYYNDTVFEFWPIGDDGSLLGKSSLAAGGRYDKLAETLGSNSELPAIGLAIGIERTLARVKDKAALINKESDDIIFIAQLGDQAKLKSLQLFEDLRLNGFNVRQSFSCDSLKTQLEEAVAMRAKTSLIMGKKEIMDGTVLVRDMDSGAQETVIYKKIKERLTKMNKIVEKKINIRKEGGLYGGF